MTYPETPGFVKGSDTSAAAAYSMAAGAQTLRRLVLEAMVAANDGMTCDEAEVQLRMLHQTCSARIRELVLFEFLYDTGFRRKTRSDRSARIYMPTIWGVHLVRAIRSQKGAP
ncbi:MAG: hypothetical protein ABW318_22865 [Vicinamibacterales bacterium]